MKYITDLGLWDRPPGSDKGKGQWNEGWIEAKSYRVILCKVQLLCKVHTVAEQGDLVGMAHEGTEDEAEDDGAIIGLQQLTGEATWTYLPADKVFGSDLGYLYLRNEITGTIIELDRGNAGGAFVFRENPRESTKVCWLRDVSCCLSNKGFASHDTIDMLELNEGERFPNTVADQVEGRASYIDKILGGLMSWKLSGRRGHVVLESVWGVEMWLIGDGFVVLSSLCDQALFVRHGAMFRTPAEDASRFMSMDRIFTWLASIGGATGAKGTDAHADENPKQKSSEHDEVDADVVRLKSWLPALPDPTKILQPPKAQTPANSEFAWLHADWEPSSRPQTRYTHGSYSSRPITRGSTRPSNSNRWSAPSARDIQEDTNANLATLERLARDGIISMEQYEACKGAALATDNVALERSLLSFQNSHYLEHRMNFFYSRMEKLRKQLEKAEQAWAVELKDFNAKHDDALLTLVREMRRTETLLEELGPPPFDLGDHEESSDSEDDDLMDKDELEAKQRARADRKERRRLEGLIENLQQQLDRRGEAHGYEHEAIVSRQHSERRAMKHQISDFQEKIKNTKRIFMEAKAEEERRKLAGEPDPRYTKKGPNTKVLQRPKAIKDNRSLLGNTMPKTYPFEDTLDDNEFHERFGQLRGVENVTMLSNTVIDVKDDDRAHTGGQDFVVGEFKELVGFTRPRVHVLEEEYDDLGVTCDLTNRSAKKKGEVKHTRNGTSKKSSVKRTMVKTDPLNEDVLLKKKLAVLQNVAITKSTRAATKPRSSPRHVVDFMMNEQDKSNVFQKQEVRAVFATDDGREYLTELPTALDWTSFVPSGHEREMSRQSLEDKHGLQRFALSETIRRFEVNRERRQHQAIDSSAGLERQTSVPEEEHYPSTAEIIEKIARQHQGSWTWASKHMRKARAAKEHRYNMDTTKGQAAEYKYIDVLDDTGFDYESAAKNTTIVIQREIPGLSTVWTPTWDLSEELFDGLSRLDSPKRRGLWSLISEADGILPVKMRDKAAQVLVYAYRCYIAKLKTRHLRSLYYMSMYTRLQCNMRMALARRILPRRRIEMASVFEERERLRLEKIRQERILKLSVEETNQLDFEDRLFWMTNQGSPVEEGLARRLLGIVEGDVAKAMGLAGFAPKEDEDRTPSIRPPTVAAVSRG